SRSRVILIADHAPPATSPLSLHDALPISRAHSAGAGYGRAGKLHPGGRDRHAGGCHAAVDRAPGAAGIAADRRGVASGPACRIRSEEHTSEFQSRENLVCRLLLEKKKRAV